MTLTCIQSVETRLRSRLYPANPSTHLRPRQILVAARQPCHLTPDLRYPFVDNHVGGQRTQPWLHNCEVTVYEGEGEREAVFVFMIFFRRHCTFTPNRCLEVLSSQRPVLSSDAVVMRVGKKANYVNMGGRDSILADWVMKRRVVCSLALTMIDR